MAPNTWGGNIRGHVDHPIVRERFYNAYEETINVPLIFSNPLVWPSGATTPAMVSLLDLVPTLAVGTAAPAAALADEVEALSTAGAGSVGRLRAILYGADTPPHVVVRAARALAAIKTPEAFAALQPAAYGPWPAPVLAQVHAAYAGQTG